jgi:hypothetical protein
LYKFWSDLRQ